MPVRKTLVKGLFQRHGAAGTLSLPSFQHTIMPRIAGGICKHLARYISFSHSRLILFFTESALMLIMIVRCTHIQYYTSTIGAQTHRTVGLRTFTWMKLLQYAGVSCVVQAAIQREAQVVANGHANVKGTHAFLGFFVKSLLRLATDIASS
jgi:hypothetical protein